jgi:hypothetical protein
MADHEPWEVAVKMAERKINVWNGDNYAWGVSGALDIRNDGSAGQSWSGALQRSLRRRQVPRSG